jgi:hypothetical protein
MGPIEAPGHIAEAAPSPVADEKTRSIARSATRQRIAWTMIDHAAARATFDGRTGYGIFEHLCLGRHDPSGFADPMTMARPGSRGIAHRRGVGSRRLAAFPSW